MIVTEGIEDKIVATVIYKIKSLKIDSALTAGTESGSGAINVRWVREVMAI